MIGPYTGLTWGGYAICNAIIPFINGMEGRSFWLTLLFAPLWGLCFVMAYRQEIRNAATPSGRHLRVPLLVFAMLNALFAMPAILMTYWLGRLVG